MVFVVIDGRAKVSIPFRGAHAVNGSRRGNETWGEGFPVVCVSPILPWERKTAWLTLHTKHVFHPFHVTTRLCLEIFGAWRKELFREGTRFLDVGCGTGIFALAAAKLGADWCVGVDPSREAIARSRENAEANGLSGRVDWVHGSVEAVDGKFHCVGANVPWSCWETLFRDIVDRVAAGGWLIASGFQDLQAPTLEGRLEDTGFRLMDRRQGDFTFIGVPPSGSFTWCAVLAQRRPDCVEKSQFGDGVTNFSPPGGKSWR